MLSFGAAPVSSCGKGNTSTLPDYLPEDDEDVVISDKVSNSLTSIPTAQVVKWQTTLLEYSSNFFTVLVLHKIAKFPHISTIKLPTSKLPDSPDFKGHFSS